MVIVVVVVVAVAVAVVVVVVAVVVLMGTVRILTLYSNSIFTSLLLYI